MQGTVEHTHQRRPGIQTKQRYARHLQQAVPEHADRTFLDPFLDLSWDTLATATQPAP
ncbi:MULTISPECIES: hypothetical protein [Streptomyces]|uniref:hypothetical protein n=1 Tax=Streptomyces TaxID=1883 RepID=UPI001E35EAD1|nr:MULTISPECIES: hypothetical protein [Streptomyces]UFQ17096.1 hypothetical protein J2N69_19965 [Streptomyces huasconensis]WCL86696.1 hypothetical protein PPN52_19970 [Streptomyces sp. JCM 35825]